ncbi:MAG: non-heme iron oxygenase ferredoxin subunit [Sulfobacillus thermosulfidooxidans]|uniref:(2Fe-2S)-binding protein n=1 Tax=Sulfobacillus thermotolerans TaxID=338644 RepID=A0ABN5GY94_9FIRM|nr:non-heme iron oxygenase ferredoxin subunit [Sulfobacillus sp. hq2]AUW93495.1 (2Fe-2S)-binding protein [Sulfobacillus thermotolerans]MCY0908144.1 non-heme iron oxygenase ferredoxin subunit [Sulfobacillus thermotolerans]POB10736.1 (2Fe-2S)-binding protein [Sulfobacillus sp. hq2]PSR32538.1 MAG: non-heme iron oxygenase ferredoxin subunit [Sulfobacillus thermosulfidooxidans]
MAQWVRVASVNDIVAGEPFLVPMEDDDIALYQVNGEYFATDDLCSHAEASLCEGDLVGYIIHCPRHGGQFDVRTGEAKHFPAYAPIRTYPVKVEGSDLFIDIEG